MVKQKSSASRARPWTRFIKRANMTGRRGGESRSDSGSSAALLLRLRRLEKVILTLSGVKFLTPMALERNLTQIEADVSIPESHAGSSDQRDEALLSLQRSPAGEASGEAGADRRPAGPRNDLDDAS